MNPRFILRGLSGTMGKCSLIPRLLSIVEKTVDYSVEFAPIHPTLSDNGHPHSLEFTWSTEDIDLYSVSDIYSPFFFSLWVMSTLRFFQTKSLLTRLEPD